MFDTFDRSGGAQFPFPKWVVFRALCEAIPSISGMKIERKDELASRLDVSVGLSAFSWGERITVMVNSTESNSCTVKVSSCAKTILGSANLCGKNRKNVAKIINQTSDILSALGPTWLSESSSEISTSANPSTSTSISDELAKLAALRDQGVLTAEEFQAAKARLLSFGAH